MQKLVCVLVSLFIVSSANAAKENWSWLKDLPEYEATVEKFELEHFLSNEKEFAKQEKISRANANRKIAQAGSDAQTPSDKLAGLVKEINDIQTSQQLDALLVRIETKDEKTGVLGYDKYADAPDAQFLLAQLSPLRLYRGLFYRLRPLLKPNSLISSGITHSMLVTFARQLAASTNIYFPQLQWKAAYSYISEPLNGSGNYWVFKDDSRGGLGRKAMEVLQQFLEEDVYNTLSLAADRMSKLAKLNQRLVWDNKVVFATESFVDGLDRYRIIGRTECLAIYSGYLGAMAGIKMFAAYNMNDLINVNYEMGKSVGFDSMGGDVTGMSAEHRKQILDGFDNFLKARKDKDGVGIEKFRERMRTAHRHIGESVGAAHLVWTETNGKGDDVWRILDPGAFRPFKRIITESMDTMKRVVDSKNPDGEIIRSAVTGQTVHVNFYKFFHGEPNNPQGTLPLDLQLFLPDRFYGGSEYYSRDVSYVQQGVTKKANLSLRNYDKGRATNWNYSEFMKYSPEASNEAGVKLVSRVLMQSWGGWGLGIPMAFVVQ